MAKYKFNSPNKLWVRLVKRVFCDHHRHFMDKELNCKICGY